MSSPMMVMLMMQRIMKRKGHDGGRRIRRRRRRDPKKRKREYERKEESYSSSYKNPSSQTTMPSDLAQLTANYWRQVDASEGFDINVEIPPLDKLISGAVIPIPDIKRPKVHQRLVELAQLALTECNRCPHINGKPYHFISVERANLSKRILFDRDGPCEWVEGDIYYITFRAQKRHVRAAVDGGGDGDGDGDDAPMEIFPPNPVEIFQAKVWCLKDRNKVVFCRPKPPIKLED